jgi:hypothetical protein
MAISRVWVTGEPLLLHSLRDQDEWFMGSKIKEYLGRLGLPQEAISLWDHGPSKATAVGRA